MAFGMERAPQMHWSKENLKFAVEKLQEKPPIFGEDTGEINGEYLAMGYKVEKDEYDNFLDQLGKLLDLSKEFLEKEVPAPTAKVVEMKGNSFEEEHNKAV